MQDDYPQAFKQFLKAAAQDHAHAQYKCAKLYEEGDGVEKNLSQVLY